MGFLRRLFGAKKSSDGKKKWSFLRHSVRSHKSLPPPPQPTPLDANKHAIAVAAATAAVAEAALAAAHAAAEVVRLTTSAPASTTTAPRPPAASVALVSLPAAVKIQSAFRGYLARRALRALKALVKLQALVRGHIVRKQTADMLRRMQTLVRLQAQARASRVLLSDNTNHKNMHSFNNFSLSHYPVPEEYEHPPRAYSTKYDLKRCSSNANIRKTESEETITKYGSNWLDRWMELDKMYSQSRDPSLKNGRHHDDDKSDKVLEVDTWKPHFKSHHNSHSFQTSNFYSDYISNEMIDESPSKRSTKALNQREVLHSLKFHKGKEEEATCSRTAENSPQALSATCSRSGNGGRRGPFTPTRSECSWGFFSGYSGYPNYMANTESFRAKVRSQSAPRQRLEFDKYGSTRRHVAHGFFDVGPISDHDSDSIMSNNRTSSRMNRIGSTSLR